MAESSQISLNPILITTVITGMQTVMMMRESDWLSLMITSADLLACLLIHLLICYSDYVGRGRVPEFLWRTNQVMLVELWDHFILESEAILRSQRPSMSLRSLKLHLADLQRYSVGFPYLNQNNAQTMMDCHVCCITLREIPKLSCSGSHPLPRRHKAALWSSNASRSLNQ